MCNIEENKNPILSEIRYLLDRANRNMSKYKDKYKNQLNVSENSDYKNVSELTENVTVSKLKKLLSKYNINHSVYLYDENTMQEKSLSVDNSTLYVKKSTGKSLTVKELSTLLDKLEWNKYLKIDDSLVIGSDITPSIKKSNKVILSLKNLKTEKKTN